MRPFTAFALVLASVTAAWSPTCQAGAFTLSPLRAELSQQGATAAFTVRNEDAAPVVVQAESMLWLQAAGEDVLEPTRDLLVSPAVFTLPANGSQLVRVALRRAPDAGRELSYRLLLQEVPQQASPDFTGLQVALRFSVPVFVKPATTAAPQLEWTAQRTADGRLELRAQNTGSSHARVLSLSLVPVPAGQPELRQDLATYVLPGQFRRWIIDDNNEAAGPLARTDRYRLKGTTERGEIVAELPVVR